MTSISGAHVPGADDLERRLAAALRPDLASPLVADAAALRVHARAGSRRIRRRRRVAAGALVVVALGGVGSLALPRDQKPSPVPLPVATPSVSLTNVTRLPSSTATPTTTPSTTVTVTGGTPTSTPAGTTPAHSPSGAAAAPTHTQAHPPTKAQPSATGPGYNTDPSTWDDAYGAFIVGDWMSVMPDTGWTLRSDAPALQGGVFTRGAEAKVNITGYECLSVGSINSDGIVAGRSWLYDQHSGWATETVSVWEPGRGREALARVQRCYSDNSAMLYRSSTRFIEANFLYTETSLTTQVRAFAVADDTMVSLYMSLTGTREEIKAQADKVLDGVLARLKAKGNH